MYRLRADIHFSHRVLKNTTARKHYTNLILTRKKHYKYHVVPRSGYVRGRSQDKKKVKKDVRKKEKQKY